MIFGGRRSPVLVLCITLGRYYRIESWPRFALPRICAGDSAMVVLASTLTGPPADIELTGNALSIDVPRFAWHHRSGNKRASGKSSW